jgi:transcriptional regulator with GAF, ATPase, and Fis domain/CHASE2 domain-containing sensor protein
MNQRLIKILITVLIGSALIIFYSLFRNFDLSIYNSFNMIAGERQPDSSIIIIHLTENDLEQIGPWPIKRSYYALLLQNLNQLKVKKVGVEIFVSAKFASQSVYDRVLQNELEKFDNITLSSVAGVITENNDQYSTDSLSFPSPKLLNETINSGHTNFIREYGIVIPLNIKYGQVSEKALSLSLFNEKLSVPDIKINFVSGWNKFSNYSFIEFLQMVQENNSRLKLFEDKIVLIGISDKQLSSGISTIFDENIPGAALHAFALDNLINDRYIQKDFYDYSIPVLIALSLAFIWLLSSARLYWKLISVFLIMILLMAVCRIFNLELAYSYFFFPAFAHFIFDVYQSVTESKEKISVYFNETEVLKNLVAQKEKQLIQLEKDLNVSESGNSNLLLDKIKELQRSITILKESEDDLKEIVLNNDESFDNFYGIVYRSTKMQQVIEIIKKAAPTDATILITGESGTGKELVANAVHQLSKRNAARLVSVNCAALAESLLESELFGHVKGAFTGALNDKVGKFEQADKGTIFLDEIGETSEKFQVKLLRVLQSGEFDKVGSEKTSKVDVRIIAATNKDLKKLIKENKFREDLYYRLNVINIHLDPLRERREDIEVLITHFFIDEKINYQISLAANKALINNDWKGNVRELESIIKRAKVFCQTENRTLIQLNDLPKEIVETVKYGIDEMVLESLRSKKFSHSSINETAKELGNVNRTLVSENFRGYSLKCFVESKFEINKSVKTISQTDDNEINNKVRSKLETWLANIKKDIDKSESDDFNNVKSELSSKYKNLPQNFHIYLDEVIKELLNRS